MPGRVYQPFSGQTSGALDLPMGSFQVELSLVEIHDHFFGCPTSMFIGGWRGRLIYIVGLLKNVGMQLFVGGFGWDRGAVSIVIAFGFV